MAKGLRSSSIKTNRKKLRRNVFAPVEVARTERLSTKLLELASQPRPAKTDMELDASEAPQDAPQDQQAEEMEIDGTTKPAASSASKKKPEKTHNRHKVRGKPQSTLTFSKKQLKRGVKTSGVQKRRIRN